MVVVAYIGRYTRTQAERARKTLNVTIEEYIGQSKTRVIRDTISIDIQCQGSLLPHMQGFIPTDISFILH